MRSREANPQGGVGEDSKGSDADDGVGVIDTLERMSWQIIVDVWLERRRATNKRLEIDARTPKTCTREREQAA